MTRHPEPMNFDDADADPMTPNPPAGSELERAVALRVAALESLLARHGPDSIGDIDIHALASAIAEKAGREETTDADYCDALIEADRQSPEDSLCCDPCLGKGLRREWVHVTKDDVFVCQECWEACLAARSQAENAAPGAGEGKP